MLEGGEIPGLEVRDVQTYAGKALYGYIDGGADLYHEYGFERLTVQEVSLRGQDYFVETYRMADPVAALGIFSVSRGDCPPADSLPPFSCLSPYAIQWASGRYFIRIANASGSPGAEAGGVWLARTIAAKIGPGSAPIPPLPLAAGANARTLVVIRGSLGAQNGCDRWGPLLEGLDRYEAYIVTRADPAGETVVGDFRFRSAAEVKTFRSAFSSGGAFRRAEQRGERRLVVLESDAPADTLWSRLVRIP
jgi:hypothetical protein